MADFDTEGALSQLLQPQPQPLGGGAGAVQPQPRQPTMGGLTLTAQAPLGDIRSARMTLQMTPTQAQLAERQKMIQAALEQQRAAAERYAQEYEAGPQYGYNPAQSAFYQGLFNPTPGAEWEAMDQMRKKMAEADWARKTGGERIRAQAETEQAQEQLGQAKGEMSLLRRGSMKPVYKNVAGNIMELKYNPLTGETTTTNMGPADRDVTDRKLLEMATKEAEQGGITDPSKKQAYINQRINEMRAGLSGSGLAKVANPDTTGGVKPATTEAKPTEGAPSATEGVVLKTPEKQAGLTEAFREQEKHAAAWKDAAAKEADAGQLAAQNASLAKQLMDQIHGAPSTGPLTAVVMPLINGLVQMGLLSPDSSLAKGAGTMGELSSVLKGIAVTHIAAFKGNFSEKDRDYVDSMVGSITDPKQKLQFNMDLVQAAAQRSVDKNEFAQRWADTHDGSLRGVDSAWQKYVQQTPLVTVVKGKPFSVYQYRQAFLQKHPGATVDEADAEWRKQVKR